MTTKKLQRIPQELTYGNPNHFNHREIRQGGFKIASGKATVVASFCDEYNAMIEQLTHVQPVGNAKVVALLQVIYDETESNIQKYRGQLELSDVAIDKQYHKGKLAAACRLQAYIAEIQKRNK